MKTILHAKPTKKTPAVYVWAVPREYVLKTGLTEKVEFDFKIHEDNSVTLTPKQQA